MRLAFAPLPLFAAVKQKTGFHPISDEIKKIRRELCALPGELSKTTPHKLAPPQPPVFSTGTPLITVAMAALTFLPMKSSFLGSSFSTKIHSGFSKPHSHLLLPPVTPPPPYLYLPSLLPTQVVTPAQAQITSCEIKRHRPSLTPTRHYRAMLPFAQHSSRCYSVTVFDSFCPPLIDRSR
jgi:hypothetical protein